jgi:hypothetical protein
MHRKRSQRSRSPCPGRAQKPRRRGMNCLGPLESCAEHLVTAPQAGICPCVRVRSYSPILGRDRCSSPTSPGQSSAAAFCNRRKSSLSQREGPHTAGQYLLVSQTLTTLPITIEPNTTRAKSSPTARGLAQVFIRPAIAKSTLRLGLCARQAKGPESPCPPRQCEGADCQAPPEGAGAVRAGLTNRTIARLRSALRPHFMDSLRLNASDFAHSLHVQDV